MIKTRSQCRWYSVSHSNRPLTICSIARQVLASWHVILLILLYSCRCLHITYIAHSDYVETHKFFYGKQCQFSINISIVEDIMELPKFFGFLLLLIVSADRVSCWDQDDLDIFDLVEEINENFYTVLKIQQVIDNFFNEICFFFHW